MDWFENTCGDRGYLKDVNIVPYGKRVLIFTHHVGRDSLYTRLRSFVDVSIHAPMWGATGRIYPHVANVPGFNSRTHVGCDVS